LIRKLIATAWVIVGLSSALLAADNWPQFRGPQSDGVAATKIPSQWGTDSNVQWKVKIPGLGWSSPIVCGDKVFVTTAITDNQTKPSGGFGMRGGGRGGRGGFGGGPGGGPGGGAFGPPQPGQILPPFLQDRLNFTDDQKKQVKQLQKDVDDQLSKLLTDEQKKTLKEPPDEDAPRPRRRPQPGTVLPAAEVERLKLSDAQKKQLDDLQKTTSSKLDKIFNADQKSDLQAMREGPGGGRRGGFGGGRGGRGGMGERIPNKIYHWQVVCLDRNTGKVLWSQQALEGKPRIPIQQSNTYASETPVSDGQRVYAYFGMHGLYCFDFDGKQLWKKDFGAYPTVMGQGPASSPVLDGERLYLQIDNEEKSFLVAVNAETGDELWRVPRDERTNHSSPVVWKNRDRSELVTSGSHKVRSYDPATGKVLWELEIGGRCYSSPVGGADMLYVGSESGMGMNGGGGGGLYAVKAGASGDITLKEHDTSNAGVAWSTSRGGPEKASPLIYQGHLYVLRTNGGVVTCYDKTTGKQIYRQRIPGAAAFWTSPWAAEGKIFCLDDAGTTHVLDAGPEFKVLGTNKLNELFWASAAVADGSIYLRGVDNLYCIHTTEAKK
jgi:outer membrane protein assembly factor BamB